MSVVLTDRESATKREPLSLSDVQLVTRFEEWCEHKGLQLDLLCAKCYEDGRPARCSGDNDPESASYQITCGCRSRVYGKN